MEVNSTGHTKDRFTACLIASADGRKLAAHIVFRGKRQPKLKLPENVSVDVAQYGTMTTEHIISWVKGPFRALRGVFHAKRPAVLVLDSYSCHMKDSVGVCVPCL